MYYAAITQIDPTYWSSDVDGASKWQHIHQPPFLSCGCDCSFWLFLQSEISSAQFQSFHRHLRIMLERSIVWPTLLMFMSATVWPSRGYRDSGSRSRNRWSFGSCFNLDMLPVAMIRVPLSSRKEDRMKNQPFKEKECVIGSILPVRRATSSLPCCWP